MDLVKFKTKEEFLIEYGIKNCIERYSGMRSLVEILDTKSITLASTKRLYGIAFTISYINEWIVSLNEFINIQRKMSPEQIEITSGYILDDFYYLKISDIYFVFSEAKKNRYGEFYESLDGAKIISWFDKYVEQRAEFVFEKGMREYERYKNQKIL